MLETAIEAASEAAKLLKKNFGSTLNINQATQHDLKLEVDELSQQLIARIVLADHPDHCILGEESSAGNPQSDVRWVVDPLDGTVNYFYGIPHYAVSIAAQERRGPDQWETVMGVVLAPELDELFATEKGKPAVVNGRPIHVSNRTELAEAIVTIGFFKNLDSMNRSLADFNQMIYKVRKMRLTGSASLDTVYVASGRFDAYIEYSIRIWDIAAGQLILENAGGRVRSRPATEPHSFDVRMWNGKIPIDDLGLPPL
jgi:myo-inositol-1(or 4)-monophosphatase